ncbi:MAG TPA: hypothetical protein VJC07_03220 [Candidatus Nanoarchaeia archaeon]|nr:hypothetical protein [Candidatus Nanoarchaeia archaeon]
MVSYKTLKALAVASVLTTAIGAVMGETANYERRNLPRTMDQTENIKGQAEYIKKEINGWYVTIAGLALGISTMGMFMRKSRLEDKAIAEHNDLKEVFD